MAYNSLHLEFLLFVCFFFSNWLLCVGIYVVSVRSRTFNEISTRKHIYVIFDEECNLTNSSVSFAVNIVTYKWLHLGFNCQFLGAVVCYEHACFVVLLTEDVSIIANEWVMSFIKRNHYINIKSSQFVPHRWRWFHDRCGWINLKNRWAFNWQFNNFKMIWNQRKWNQTINESPKYILHIHYALNVYRCFKSKWMLKYLEQN